MRRKAHAKISAMTLQIANPDLTADPAAQRAIKDERVWVQFSDVVGELKSADSALMPRVF
jgi:hypothetical protein